ncbi:DUF431-domain-containing protein [Calocera cornea HHB12733]|uniref:DUF431-domain-containing protein n=1 Tax=Calocera cornea HHB12733 TaxID=1353952 RepID=A0A165EB65_9BASI|nr:DUF431-domain-containing protein [Calocera cornea HHB12733]
MVSFVIEHMEEDDQTTRTFPPWVQLEYNHMRALAGPASSVHFTHVSPSAAASLGPLLTPARTITTITSTTTTTTTASSSPSSPPALAPAEVHTEGFQALLKSRGVPLEKVCLLDPKAPEPLRPGDGELFEWFLFGGILGDDPPRDRTSELRALGFPGRHLGQVQMTTDTALGVTKRVVVDKGTLPYVDFPTIRFNARESVEMPFRYLVQGGEPLMPPGMRELLYEDLDKGFEF